MQTLEVKFDASPLAYDLECVMVAIERAIKEEIQCQLYSLSVSEVATNGVGNPAN